MEPDDIDWPDDIEEQIKRDELEDQAEIVGQLTPREYAQLRGMAPQLVYYYIRQGVLETFLCLCGRKVINVAKSDQALAERKDKRG